MGVRLSARSSALMNRDGSPFQLAGAGRLSNRPTEGAAARHKLEPGQLAILHSDGLLASLSVQEVAAVVNANLSRGPSALAKLLASEACAASVRPQDVSVKRGKPDDVTVVCVAVDALR